MKKTHFFYKSRLQINPLLEYINASSERQQAKASESKTSESGLKVVWNDSRALEHYKLFDSVRKTMCKQSIIKQLVMR